MKKLLPLFAVEQSPERERRVKGARRSRSGL